jgi:hypothetical protein
VVYPNFSSTTADSTLFLKHNTDVSITIRKRPWLEATTDHHSVLKLRMYGVVPSLPFMPWSLFMQGALHFTFGIPQYKRISSHL